MNLYDLNDLIACLNVEKDKEAIAFYKKKRVELIAIINKEIKHKLKGIL